MSRGEQRKILFAVKMVYLIIDYDLLPYYLSVLFQLFDSVFMSNNLLI